ncbi:MAG: shikimate dehydrogenase, partial [Gaiellaceae bacterium]|nr:shikimate dehydrogenase [Gaiellaceae bacterium]
MITGETRLVGLLGDPVSHSLSPLLQNAAFAARGLDWAYVPLAVTAEQLSDAIRGLVALGFAGANVTTPHKLAVAKLVETDEESVNTLVIRDGSVQGSSTDTAILDGLKFENAAIVGDGGAAIAFAAALPE